MLHLNIWAGSVNVGYITSFSVAAMCPKLRDAKLLYFAQQLLLFL